MGKYVYPCIITKENGMFIAHFPDIDNRLTSATNLFDILKLASNILLLETYMKEMLRETLPLATDIDKIKISDNQHITYIFCDTESLSNELDLYDDIKIEDMVNFYREKDKELNRRKLLINKKIEKPSDIKENQIAQEIEISPEANEYIDESRAVELNSKSNLKPPRVKKPKYKHHQYNQTIKRDSSENIQNENIKENEKRKE